MKIKSYIPVLFLGALLACGSQQTSQANTSSSTAPASQSSAAGPAPFAMPPFGLFNNFLNMSEPKPGLYEEPKQSPDFQKDAEHYAVIELGGSVSELGGMGLFGGGGGLSLRDIQERLYALAKEENVVGVLLRVGDLSADMATAEELQSILRAFKTGGKDRRLLCHTEGAENISYLVMMACDRIGLAPNGMLAISGPVATPLHLKGLLDRLGITADFVHIGAFKGAAEPLTRDAPSPEMYQTLEAIVETSYQTLLNHIVVGRRLAGEQAQAAIDKGLWRGEQAVEAGLIDEIATFAAFREKNLGGLGWRKVSLKKEKNFDVSQLDVLLGMRPKKRPEEPHVALVYAIGNIIDGKGAGIVGARQEIASRTLTAALDALAEADSVKAVVLRIDSGGGSALASEQIWHALNALKEKKPLIVSMGGMAASGGYYIAAPADKIYAQANTLTGSIGVVGGKIALGEALEKIGVKTYSVKRGQNSGLWSPFVPWSAEEKQLIRELMESVYDVFVDRVASGRKKTKEEIHAIAQGRVWTGLAAKENGLVDEIGGLADALAEARSRAGLGEDSPLEVYPPEPSLFDLLGSELDLTDLLQQRMELGLPLSLSGLRDELSSYLAPVGVDALLETLKALSLLKTHSVLAVSFFPVVVR